ncbi:MAG TPA: cupin domain-containing protein [Terriglobales bacterium]|nr:cupin domain-containing protein [Terriglobales bacterium]
MNTAKCRFLWAVLVLIAPSMFVSAQQTTEKPQPAMRTHFIVASSEVKWTDPPAGVARGTPSVEGGGPLRYALLEGDPLKPGVPFTVRLGCDDGYKAAPHWHPTDENIVVLKGTFELGTGDTFNPSGMQEISAGSYGFMPRRMHHFGQCKGDTDILVYGVGPFQINWISGPGTSAAGKPSAK